MKEDLLAADSDHDQKEEEEKKRIQKERELEAEEKRMSGGLNINEVSEEILSELGFLEIEEIDRILKRRPFKEWQELEQRGRIPYEKVEKLRDKKFYFAQTISKMRMTAKNSAAFAKDPDEDDLNFIPR